jgi:hypothetical protein
MATVIGVGMQMTANASGMTKGLSDADKALQLLQKIVDQNQKSLQRFTGEADKTTQSLDKLNRGVSTLSTIEIGRVLVDGFTALGSAFTSAAQNVLTLAGNVSSSLDSLNDLSARTGIGVEALQGYSLAAKMAGVDTEAFGVAVQKLSVNIGKATPGDALDKSLRSINLSVAELRALSPEQQFAAVGEAIGQLPTAADRAAAAVQLFGKQGAALAPLFREGAASIEELRAKAERLGIIVSETQINNVADMNDAFDLVSATIQGIIGQVVGNLAPAVTEVTNQFLQFVEEWSGAQGEGGTGIANAITDVLLQGAEVFAGVFDRFVGNFSGLTESLVGAGEAFSFVANILTAASESFRVVFNVFESIGNGIALALGKALEGIGSLVSSDLEATGKALQATASAALEQQSRDLESAATNAANALNNAVFGGDAAASGSGAATEFVQGMRDQIERERTPQFKVETNIENTRERFDAFFNGIVEQENAVTDAMREFEAATAAVVDPLNMTKEEMDRINAAQEKVNTLIDEEQRKRIEAADAATAQAEADGKRVDSLLKTSDAASKLEEDLAAVERQRAAVAEQGGEDAKARLAELDALKAKLEEQQQALEQGFGQGFEQAFEGADKAVDTAIEKAAEFGQVGFDAAQQLADGVAEAQRQAEAGILNQEAYDAEVARQQQIFDQRIANEKQVIAERKKAEDEAAKVRLQQEDLVNNLIKQQQVGGDQERIAAAENLVAINAEIARAEQAAAEARKAGDGEAQQAALTRLQQLDQVKAKEEDIASGAARQRQLFQEQFIKQQEEAAKAQQQQQQAAAQEQARLAEERRKAEEAEYNRQVARITELNTLGSRTVNTADIRTQEGQALVLGLAANAQDPALIEARLQTKQLQLIAGGIAQAAGNYFNTPVAIVGGAVLG